MPISERVQNALAEGEKEIANNPDFTKLRDFYAEMLRLGIAQKQEYTLPPLDTIGRRMYQTAASVPTAKG